jgi:hypothetical protein
MEYKFFQIQDFIKDDAFVRWVKYGENDVFFQAFILDHPEKQTTISKASDFIKKVAEAEKIRQPNISQSKVWSAISDNIDNDSESLKPSLLSKSYATKWAKISWARLPAL